MKTFLKVFALIIISILLFAVGWVYCVGMGAERTVLSQSYYQGIFEKVDQVIDEAYEVLERQLTDQFMEEIDKSSPGEGPPEELPAVFVASLTEAFPREWFRTHFLAASDEILSWIKGQQELPTLTIDLSENKQALEEILLVNLEELAADMGEEIPGGAAALVQEILGDVDIPDEISLGELLAEELPSEVEERINLAQRIRTHFLYAPYVLFALFLALSCLLAGIAGGLKWFGITTLICGGTLAVGLLTFQFALLSPLYKSLETDIPVAFDTIKALASYTVFRLATVPLIVAGTGLLLLIIGIVITKIKKKREAA